MNSIEKKVVFKDISNISNTANSITFSQTAATYNTDLNNIHTTNGSSYWVRYL